MTHASAWTGLLALVFLLSPPHAPAAAPERRPVPEVATRLGESANAGDAGFNLSGEAPPPDTPLALWYCRPARAWTEALPVGNGRLGGMVYGGVARERIALNEDTLWSGEPWINRNGDPWFRNNVNPKGREALPRIEELLLAGRNAEADQAVKDLCGRWNDCYLPLGDLFLDFGCTGAVTGYRRELDLRDALARTSFTHDGAHFVREVLVSHPDQVLAVRVTADQPGRVSFRASLDSMLRGEPRADGAALRWTGQAPIYADYHARRVTYAEGRGMRFEMRLEAVPEGGAVRVESNALVVSGCDAVTLLLAGATSYNGYEKDPVREGRDPAALCRSALVAAAGKSFADLRAAHTADVGALFNRVSLDLGPGPALPTDLRIKAARTNEDPALAALFYQYARYLLIASSRPGTQPANLQGIWSYKLYPEWACDWTVNCNAEINYWPAETGNLPECVEPLIQLTEDLSVTGARVARELYGRKGWVAHHTTDLWRGAGPNAVWSIFQAGGTWLSQHLWEHYAFSGDPGFLRRIWPVLKGAAEYHLDGLIEYPGTDELGSWPDLHFECRFKKPDGTVALTCIGPTANMEMIRALFRNTMAVSRLLDEDADLRGQLEATLPRLAPIRVSPRTGMLQEWIEDWEHPSPGSGQVLSTWGLWYDAQITPRGTPELAAAVRKTYADHRMPVGSWVSATKCMTWARLGDGERFAAALSELIRSCNANLTPGWVGCPWQIDGNLGPAATLVEALLQSHAPSTSSGRAGEIELLPALPKGWPAGKISGLRARGGFTVDVAWEKGEVTAYRIGSATPTQVALRVNGDSKVVTTPCTWNARH